MDASLRTALASDADWIAARHGALYAEAEGFDPSFEDLVRGILRAFFAGHDPDRERGWIAEAGGRRLGSIFCVDGGEGRAKLRLFLVEPAARGTGLGRRMLAHCLAFAQAQDCRGMTLWTHESHRAACALYAAAGFRLVTSVPVRSFGVDLVEQTWTLDFAPPPSLAIESPDR